MDPNNDTNILIYQTEDGTAVTEVRLDAETVWLRQEQMAQLFGRERSVITKHLRNVFAEGELEPGSVCAKFAHTDSDSKTYQAWKPKRRTCCTSSSRTTRSQTATSAAAPFCS